MKNILLVLILFSAFVSCEKSQYLSALPNQSLVVPKSLSDFQALLDNDGIMNGRTNYDGIVPDFEEASSDDYYANSNISTVDIGYTNLYLWNDNIYSTKFSDWNNAYRTIFYANEVLDGASQLSISSNQQQVYNNLIGSALFYRAHCFYHLSQIFAPPYDKSTSNTDDAIALRLTSDINEKISRATVQKTYDQIISDVKRAIPLLPLQPLYLTRPSRPAAYGLLAKVYLSMRDYDNALVYADSALKINSSLLDYNAVVNNPGIFKFKKFNTEVIFQALQILNSVCSVGIGRVDSTLYLSYDNNDLRKQVYFFHLGVGYAFVGSYDGSSWYFGGITTDEMYLIRAECYARKQDITDAMNDLNALLITRWKTGSFILYSATTASDALNQILSERRKELVFRGTRWIDLRRLNKEGSNITITRVLNGSTYTLAPNSLHYTFLIPPDVMNFNPSLQQNPR